VSGYRCRRVSEIIHPHDAGRPDEPGPPHDAGFGAVSGRDGEADEASHSHLSPGARAFVDWVLVVGIALLVAILVRTFVLAHFVVDGTSMATTLDTGDRVFVNKVSYRLHEPNRGDVVVLHQISGTAERDLIKRVIGLPGEVIEVQSCEVRIDGRLLIEPYLDPAVVTPGNCGGDTAPTEIPDGHVFVMGDNRSGSQDSRALGPIAHDELVGRAFVVFWPRSNWQWL
jgi:signal peptidase I